MWIDTNLIKNFKVFKVNLGQRFNVETISNGYRYLDIKIIYAYEKVVATSYEWDSTLTLNGNYPEYYFTAKENVTNESLINVLIMEGDYVEDIVDDTPKSGQWVTMSVLGRMAVFKLNKSNNFSINLDLDLGMGKWTKGKYSIIPMVSSMKFTEYDRGYDLSLTNLGGNNYKVNLKNWRFKGNYVDTASSSSASQDIYLRDDCIFASCIQAGGAGAHSVYLKMFVNDNLIYNTRTYEHAQNTYTHYKPYGSRDKITMRGDGSFKYYLYKIRQYLSEYKDVDDYEITCLIVEELN